MSKKLLSIALSVVIFVSMIEVMYFSSNGDGFTFIAGYTSSYVISILFYKILFYKDAPKSGGSNE